MENNINKRYKSFTSLEQSKKLAEILPLESADLYYYKYGLPHFIEGQGDYESIKTDKYRDKIPCWSLAALLNVLPKEIETGGQRYAPCLFPVQDKWLLRLWYNSNYIITSPISIFSDNPIDACVAMIEKLHKLKML